MRQDERLLEARSEQLTWQVKLGKARISRASLSVSSCCVILEARERIRKVNERELI